MSFSFEIKDEILKLNNSSKCCLKAEFISMINYIAKINYLPKTKETHLIIQSENIEILKKFQFLFQNIFKKDISVSCNNKQFIIKVKDQSLVAEILNLTEIDITNAFFNTQSEKPDKDFLAKTCCKRAYLKIAFVCCGYICNPEKNYHIEFISSEYSQALELKEIMLDFGINAKILERKGVFVLYIKEGEQIVDLLNIISAHKALLKLENIRILKDVRNNINRIVNCETANLNKTIYASVSQKQDIELIDKLLGIENLPPQLKEAAKLRIKFPNLSLKELAEKLNPPISKSGINHRFTRINNIANKLRGI